jgi:hypothetical protein
MVTQPRYKKKIERIRLLQQAIVQYEPSKTKPNRITENAAIHKHAHIGVGNKRGKIHTHADIGRKKIYDAIRMHAHIGRNTKRGKKPHACSRFKQKEEKSGVLLSSFLEK